MTNEHEMSAALPSTGGNADLWTVLVYMAADNNLGEECVFALTEMLRAGAHEELNLMAQFDAGTKVMRYDFRELRGGEGRAGARRAAVRVGDLAQEVRFEQDDDGGRRWEGQTRPPEEVPDAKKLEDFLAKAILATRKPAAATANREAKAGELASAAPYLVVLSGHGSGAVGDFLNTENPPDSLSIPRLRDVLEKVRHELGREIDVLGMDSCLMSMAEVGYELRGTVNFMVGAEGFQRNTGWPYHNILAALRDDPQQEPRRLARAIVEQHISYYADYTAANVSVDHAACDLRQSEALKLGMTELARVLTERLEYPEVRDAILLAHWRAQSYKSEQYVDLWDFCHLLEQGCADSDVNAACAKARDAVEQFVMLACFSGAAFQHSHGLSVYFPWSKSDLERDLPAYRQLAFSSETGWANFLEAYGRVTQREVRDKSGSNKEGECRELSMPPRGEAEANVRDFPAVHQRGPMLREARVKNPPDRYQQCEDDCAGRFSE